ncbi:MAG: EF-hand domain-containing protein [Methylophilaceae bacterium]|nr:EF-hand domain-containing protein [Methylophilaceae bacterium]
MNRLFSLLFTFFLAWSGLAFATSHDEMGDHCMRKGKSVSMPADTDNDGTVDWEEAHNAFVKHFDEMDINQDGVLSADEMKDCCCMHGKHCKDSKCKDGKCKRNKAAHERGDRAFAAADKDKDGTLDRQEAKKLPRVYKNFDAIDVDKDGTVDREEVHNFMINRRR